MVDVPHDILLKKATIKCIELGGEVLATAGELIQRSQNS
uniref:Uncharacterized protein n=1 Tax=Candidozyma auris TaxID=498019 RepID=A0A0L0P155_CANAR